MKVTTTGAAMATGAALVACVMVRLPHRLLDGAGIEPWVAALVVVVAAVNGARSLARAPFTVRRHARPGRDRRPRPRRLS